MKIVIGQGSCGIASGAKKTEAAFREQVKAAKLKAEIDTTGCVGTCYLEPIVDVYEDDGKMTRYVHVQPEKVGEIIESHIKGGKPVEALTIQPEDSKFIDKQKRVVLRHCGLINPEIIEDYINVGGYEATKKGVTSMKPEEVIEENLITGSPLAKADTTPASIAAETAKTRKSFIDVSLLFPQKYSFPKIYPSFWAYRYYYVNLHLLMTISI